MKKNQPHLLLSLALSFAWCSLAPISPSGAQILPDATLGNENSIVTPLTPQLDQIDGGAIRANNLFHSFGQFNIDEGAAAYFSNPSGINNIFSRVTGSNPSHLFGTLGVSGDANLYFLNPNGIIFGPNARLDISGSFFASTANSLIFPDGTQFSASNPEALPLLTVNVRPPIGLIFEGDPSGTIVNAGDLETGKNLTLVGGTVISSGQLSAPTGEVRLATVAPGEADDSATLSDFLSSAGEELGVTVTDAGEVRLTESGLAVEMGNIALAGGSETASVRAASATLAAANTLTLAETTLQTAGNLNLRAVDTVRIRDSQNVPFLAQAGGNLSIQGNESIDILALNHPQTPFQSGGNLSLVSDGIISGDAHFSSGGTFSVLNLAGEPGEFVSLYDPIISSESDVVLGDYTGVALKVESRGNITTGDVTITGRDTSLIPGSDPDIGILRSEPALILRAGVEELQNPPTVYWNNFSGNVGPEWSNTAVDITPIGERTFLGQFGNETVSLTLDDLPSHDEVNVSFDLFIIRSWDGNHPQNGPDIWQLDVAGVSRLFDTTFSTTSRQNLTQSYPSTYTSPNLINNPARTGAIERDNSLGYFFNSSIGRIPLDSVYRLNRSFSHSNSQLQLDFFKLSRNGDNRISDESWGLTNVNISLPNTPPEIVVSQPTSTFPGMRSPGTITTGNLLTPNGPIILSATSDIALNGTIDSQGGDIDIESNGGAIQATGGNITSSGGNITFNSTDAVNVTGIFMDSSNSAGTGKTGDISVNARSLSITDEARLLARVVGNNPGGNITITTTESVNISSPSANATSSGLFATSDGTGQPGTVKVTTPQLTLQGRARILTEAYTPGNAGPIFIDTDRLSVRDGARISAFTQFQGDGGAVNIKADEFIELAGTSADGLLPSAISTASFRSGDAGTLTIETPQLFVRDGAIINTTALGSGRGGDLTILNAFLVELVGTSANGQIASALSTDTAGSNRAGDLTVNTDRLVVRDGAVISASTAGTGRGGNLTVHAADAIELRGTSAINGVPSGLYAQTVGDGQAGNLSIRTGELTVRDQARVTVAAGRFADGRVSNFPPIDPAIPVLSVDPNPTGDAGNIEITANTILLDRQGQIIAQTEASEGGNITLDVRDYIFLRRNSTISATAGTAQAGGNGGNITIRSPFILAIPQENSDITANAFEGDGGRISITARGIYGLQFRPRLTPLSDITASSELGRDGIVEIEVLNIDPTRGLANLPTQARAPGILEGCPAGEGWRGVEYFEVGRGGLAAGTDDLFDTSFDIPQWVPFEVEGADAGASGWGNPTEVAAMEEGWVWGCSGRVYRLN
jgi:filamentous hemagglutinin family protein